MKKQSNKYDFLKEITSSNIAKVKASFQFEFDNYTTLYVVDTFDIVEFCFPAVFNTPTHDNSQLNISSFLGYEFFFFNHPRKHLLLEEHKVELYSFWQRVRRGLSEFSSYKDLKNDMMLRYKEFKNENDKIYFIESNLGMLLAIAFGALSKTPLDRFQRLISEKLEIQSVSVEEKDDSKLVEEIVLDTKPNISIVNEAFDYLCQKKMHYLQQLPDEQQAGYLQGAYTDVKVYDRITRINEKLLFAAAEGKLKRKYNVLFLSSVTKKIDIIEEFYRAKSFLPLYQEMQTESLHRNNMEVYLFQLLNVNDPANENSNIVETKKDTNIGQQKEKMIIDLLEKLEDVSKSYSDNEKKIDAYRELFTDNPDFVNPKLLKSGKDIDDIFLKYHSMKFHRDKIDEAIGKLKATGQDADLLSEFTRILSLDSVQHLNDLSVLENSIDHYASLMSSKSEIVKDINFLKTNKDNLSLQIRQGKDSVKSSIQAFPILLFYKKSSFIEIQKLLKQLILPDNQKQTVIQKLINTPGRLLYEFSTFEKRLFYLFVRYLFDPDLKEDNLLAELDECLELNKKFRLETSFLEGQGLQFHFIANDSLRLDILTFKTWVLRREDEYEAAIDIINNAASTTMESLDVRLVQSRALCYKSWYYKKADIESANKLEEYLNFALSDFFVCENKYTDLQQQGKSGVLMLEIVSAISNSIIDTYTKLYLLDQKKYESFINSCRERLVKLKVTIPEAGANYDAHWAFGHTEIDLEFCEANIALNSGKREKAINKIQAANARMEKILQTEGFVTYEAFEKTKNMIRKLAKALLTS